MRKKDALIVLEQLPFSYIEESMDDYYQNRERKDVVNRFIYENKEYPTMNIVLVALKLFNEEEDENLDVVSTHNLNACKEILRNHFGNQIIF